MPGPSPTLRANPQSFMALCVNQRLGHGRECLNGYTYLYTTGSGESLQVACVVYGLLSGSRGHRDADYVTRNNNFYPPIHCSSGGRIVGSHRVRFT